MFCLVTVVTMMLNGLCIFTPCRNNECNIVKTCILGMMSGKRSRGRPRMQYIDNTKKWTRASLEENVRLTEDKTAWRERSCGAGAANVRTDDAD